MSADRSIVSARRALLPTFAALLLVAAAGSAADGDGAKSAPPPAAGATGDDGGSAPAEAPEDPGAAPDPERRTPDLVVKGFGDINLVYTDDGAPGGFSLGELDLFITSELAADLSVLAEIVIEPQEGSLPEVELERYVIQWAPRDAIRLALGRMHTALGYWNRAYHHGAWFQTTIERPIVYRWEHDHGVLPVHEVGLALLGTLPVSSLSLEYSTSVTNGRGPDPMEVQDLQDANSQKAVNLWLAAGPRSLPALKLGGSVRFDRIPPPADQPQAAGLDETIATAFVAFTPRRGELLAELARVEHEARDTGERWRTTGLYVQGALRLGSAKPYYRYDYQDVQDGEPYYGESGAQSRHTLGVRTDPWSWAALKLEVYRESPAQGEKFSAVAFQAAFTF
jgi:hypothetical protein